jgi:sulfur carrier protein
MKIEVNGEPRDVAPRMTIAELLEALGIDAAASGLAVARNGDIVTRRQWGETALAEADRLEIIRATQGG